MKLYIKEAREKVGLNQKELASKLGIAPSTMAGYESGKHDPGSERLKAIARICGVSIDFLLGREDRAPALALPSLDEKRQYLFDAVANMSDEEVAVFVSMITRNK